MIKFANSKSYKSDRPLMEDSKPNSPGTKEGESADSLDRVEVQSVETTGVSPFAVPYPTKADASIYKYICYLEFLLKLRKRCDGSQEVESEICAVLSTKGPIVRGCSLLHIRTVDSLIRRLKSFSIDLQYYYDAITLIEKELFKGNNVVCPQVDRDELLSSFYVLIGLLNKKAVPVYFEEVYCSIWGLVRQIDGSPEIQDSLFDERNMLVNILHELYAYSKKMGWCSDADLPIDLSVDLSLHTEKATQHLIDIALRKHLLEQLIPLYKGMIT